MPWLLVLPVYQQPWYWLCKIVLVYCEDIFQSPQPFQCERMIQNCKVIQLSAVITQYNIVRFYIKKLQELRQNINQMQDPQKTPHTSRAMGCFLWIFVKKLTALQRHCTICMFLWTKNWIVLYVYFLSQGQRGQQVLGYSPSTKWIPILIICLRHILGTYYIGLEEPGSAFIKPDQLDPWIKDQIKITLLPTISHLQLPNFVSFGRACPSHMILNLVTVGAKIVDSRAFPIWSLIHGLRWSGLIKAEPGLGA